jgi:hypothetical protein
MRTKTLLLTAALAAAGIASSMAQAVYSVNAVGYVNTALKPGLNLVSNPLTGSDNSVKGLFTGVPAGTQVYKFNGTGFTTYSYVNAALGWQPASAATDTTLPGDGVFVRNTTATDVTVTFVGEVPQGTLANPIPVGLSIKSSQVPQAGLLGTDLGFPVAAGDQVYKYNTTTGKYDTFSFVNAAIGWQPSQPNVDVGQAVFVRKNAATSWNRTFSVNG